MVGTGADLGEVKIKFQDGAYTLSSATLYIDQIFVAFSAASSSYENGAIWIDDSVTNTGTIPGIDGVATNPVSTWAAALTLSASTNLNKFQIANGTAITLTADSSNFALFGEEWTLALGGQVISNMYVEHASVSGSAIGTSYRFIRCKIALAVAVSLEAGGMKECAVGDAGISLAAGTYLWDGCFSGVAGTGTPSVDFGAAVGNTNFNMRHYSGGIEIENMGQAGTDNMSLEGFGQYVLNANCAGGTLAVRGAFQKTDNSGLVTIVDEANIYSSVIEAGRAQAATANTITLASTASATDGAYDPAMIIITGGTGDGQCRLILEYTGASKVAVVDRNWKVNPDATSDYKILADAGRENINEGLAQAGAAGTITLNALASASDDAYNNQLVFIRSGTGEDQVRLVTDYDGTTKIATVGTNWAVNPDATSGYVMLPTSIYSSAEISALINSSLDSAIPASPTANSINEYIRNIKYTIVNKMEITEANGNTVVYEDDDSTPHASVNSAFTSDSTTTTRLRLE